MPNNSPTKHMIESNDFSEILSHIDPDNPQDALVLLDIDHNLIVPGQSLGIYGRQRETFKLRLPGY